MPNLPFSLSRRAVLWLLVSIVSSNPSFAHDAMELTSVACLRSNRLELNVTIAAATTLKLAQRPGAPPVFWKNPGEFAEARSLLQQRLAELYEVTDAGARLSVIQTNVTLGVEDHVQLQLVYALPVKGPLHFTAALNPLPREEGYGALLNVLDLVNEKFLGQKLLTASDAEMEVPLPASFISTNALPAPVSGKNNSVQRAP